MRVLFVTHNVPRFPGDAAGSFVLRLAVALQAAGARVDVIAPGAVGLPEHGTVEGVTIQRVRYASDEAMTLAYTGTMVEEVKRSWAARLALFGLLRALRRATRARVVDAAQRGDPFDIVHAHWWFPAGLALWRVGGTPRSDRAPGRVVTMHGSDVRLAQLVKPAQWLLRMVLDSFDARTVVSSWLASTVRTMAPGREVVVAPMPVDTSRFVMAPGSDHAPRRGILFVGRLNAQKGIADLVQALVRPDLTSAVLDVVGDGPDKEALTTMAARLGVGGRIRWLGARPPEALASLYRGAAVLAMPSRDEGLGLVAVEAQLCGTPVVGYASGGLVDTVREPGGVLVPEGDIAALSAALAESLAEYAGARTSVDERAVRARNQTLSRFSPEAVSAQYLAVYRATRADPPAAVHSKPGDANLPASASL